MREVTARYPTGKIPKGLRPTVVTAKHIRQFGGLIWHSAPIVDHARDLMQMHRPAYILGRSSNCV